MIRKGACAVTMAIVSLSVGGASAFLALPGGFLAPSVIGVNGGRDLSIPWSCLAIKMDAGADRSNCHFHLMD